MRESTSGHVNGDMHDHRAVASLLKETWQISKCPLCNCCTQIWDDATAALRSDWGPWSNVHNCGCSAFHFNSQVQSSVSDVF